ncbi:DNA-binding protein [candidate division KSB1 bacterium]|nr:DNA-binding protein [candidate division KSB1 bacterium]
MSTKEPDNEEIAGILRRIADLLDMQDANRFRVQAYRKAAQNIEESDENVAELAQKGAETLQNKLSGVGEQLARVIEEYVTTGRSGQLERLQGQVSPEDLFQKVPGIGEEMAERIAKELDIDTLEELELAAHDGRLGKIEGFGEKRLQGVRDSLAGMLSRSTRRRKERASSKEESSKGEDKPDVALILDVDEEYRRRAEADELKKIAPKRFNPEGKAWLPVLHTERKEWSFTALYSNTARAHDLDKTRDWVVIYYERDSEEDQCTVVTASRGDLEGKRIIRGREKECRHYYDSKS